MRKGLLTAAVTAALATAAPAGAASLEQVGSFESPVFVTSDPGDPNRLFVVEQEGRIVLTQGGATSTFADLSSLVLSGGEQGLLSMAFATDFASSGRFYVYYTSRPSGDIQVDELTATGSSVDLATRRPVITIPHRRFGNHNGGQLQIGPDGMLYLATGDGGGGGDPDGNAQNLNSLLGKVLRIDPRPSGGASYSIPPGNPFAGREDTQDEIWSYGLRNPYRFSFDRMTGAIAIGDVGQGSWEEVDYLPGPNAGRGANFGWDCREGAHEFSGADESCPGTGFTDPIFEYANGGENCAITGGYVVRDESLGDLYGRYVYADFCGGEIRSLVPGFPAASGDRSEGLSVEGPSSFGEDSCGRAYVVSLDGPVYRLVGGTPPSCAGPGIELSARKRQDMDGRIRLKVRSDEVATALARARLVTNEKGKGKRAARGKVARLPRRTVQVGPGNAAKLKWKLSRKKSRMVRRKLRKDRVIARFTVRATDAAGNLSREKDRSRIVR